MTATLKAVGQVNLQEILARGVEAAAESAVPSGSSLTHAADRLRLLLAVRGWTAPAVLLEGEFAPEQINAALASVALDAETSAAARPGDWFLGAQARVQTLAGHDSPALADAAAPLHKPDAADLTRWAFALALEDAPVELRGLDEGHLRALANVREWLGEGWQLPFGVDQITAALAAKTLDADLARMTELPLVGESHRKAFTQLAEFAVAPRQSSLAVTYIHATGGGGKTTLLAFLQQHLRGLADPPAVARIDFDEPAIDPASMVTLNLALFEQLASSVAGVGGRIADNLAMLRRTASAQRASEMAGQPLAGWRRGDMTRRSLAKERAVSESAGDQGSILGGLLAPWNLGGPLVVILDTAELVLSRSDRAAAGIAAWLEFLQTEADADDLRLIIAGRDPPPVENLSSLGHGEDDLLSRLASMGAVFAPPLALPELVADEADELLHNCGVDDANLRRKAAEAVPGNPLLLRITATALLQGDPELVNSVHSAHNEAKIDPTSARNYLMRRIVAHVGDPVARPYLLAAMMSPLLTRSLLGKVIMPVVDATAEAGVAEAPKRRGNRVSRSLAAIGRLGRQALDGKGSTAEVAEAPKRRAERVFRSLAGIHWLGRQALDGKSITFNRDLRAFVLKLVAASPDDAKLTEALHRRALDYHTVRKTSADRALAVYHAAQLGLPYRSPRRSVGALQLLREVYDELQADVRDHLFGGDAGQKDAGSFKRIASRAADTFLEQKMSDEDWRLYLEGGPKREGQGDQLVGDDRATEALKLYRGRPTRAPGRPPTFVLQALADLGEWYSEEADIDALFADADASTDRGGRSGLSPTALSHIYWIARLALLKNNGKLTESQMAPLLHVSELASGPGLTMLPALLAVAEASSGRRVMSERMARGVRGNEAEGRIHLARREPMKTELAASQLAVAQRDWFARVRSSPGLPNASALHWVQQKLDGLHGQPMAGVNHAFAELRRTVPVTWDGRDMADGIVLLRGQTIEFLRPLREALAEMHADEQNVGFLRDIVSQVLGHMTIKPIEMQDKAFFERLAANPRAWLTSFVSYADRCRLLPLLCETTVSKASNSEVGQKAARIARSFLAWDQALCGGGSSEWSD